jgi:hypothetical protein
MSMNPTLVLLFSFAPVTGLTAWLVGHHYLTKKRCGRLSTLPSSENIQPRLNPATGDRPTSPVVRDFQLTTMLVVPGEVLLGYRATTASTRGRSPSTGVSPSATGTLLFSLGHDPDAALSILDGWCREGVALALRMTDEHDTWALCDRRTSRRLVLSEIQTQ